MNDYDWMRWEGHSFPRAEIGVPSIYRQEVMSAEDKLPLTTITVASGGVINYFNNIQGGYHVTCSNPNHDHTISSTGGGAKWTGNNTSDSDPAIREKLGAGEDDEDTLREIPEIPSDKGKPTEH